MTVWLLLAPLLPLTLAVTLFLARNRPRLAAAAERLAPVSLLPALGVGLFMPGTRLTLEAVLLGMHLGVDPTGRVFLVLSAAFWLLALVYARPWLAADAQRPRFTGFMLAAAAGNLGLCLAQDTLSFYWLFTLMSLSAWVLVLHRGDAAARRAGRVYLVLAVLGEVALLLALLPIVNGGGIVFADVPAAIMESAWRDTIIALLLIGFGTKVGVLGLHVALPLAYAATPVPGAAALASAMIHAGLLGWMRFLPFGEALPGWGLLFLVLGLSAAYFGIVAGLLQIRPKVILAYSSVSQLGLMTAGIGLALTTPAAAAPALFALTLYSVHHASAKAALFLGEGLARTTRGRTRTGVLAGMLLAALALAGGPLTGGALAKQHLKDLAAGLAWADAFGTLLLVASIGTTLLMARLLWRLRAHTDEPRGAASGALPAWYAALVLSLGGVWLLPFDRSSAWAWDALSSAGVPLAVGALLALFGARALRGAGFDRPPRDALGALAAQAGRLGANTRPVFHARPLTQALRRRIGRGVAALARPSDPSLEDRLRSGRGFGAFGLGLTLLLVVLLAFP